MHEQQHQDLPMTCNTVGGNIIYPIMKSLIISLMLLGSIELHAVDNVLVWNVVPQTSSPIRTNTLYRLFNQYNRSYLDYWSRSRGIDLAFNRALATPNIKFQKQGNPNEPVKYGDRIAIHVARGGYLYYCVRIWGINLCYSSTPVYQWELRDASYLGAGAHNREVIPGRATFSLFNASSSITSYLIYGSRPVGPNLKWATTVPPPVNPSTQAQVNLSFRTGPYAIPSTSGRCTSRITWSFTPLGLTGASGRTTAFTIDKFYEVTETTVGPGEIWCIFGDLAIGLKAGRWKIRAQTPVWATECEVTLNNGVNNVKYTQYKNGCTTGIQFP
jgi:hypothetical protein